MDGDTFINGNITELTGSIEGIVRQMPWLFGLALFVMSILLYSQAATVRAIVPLGIALGISPMMLIALFPAVNGYFFILIILRWWQPSTLTVQEQRVLENGF